MSLPIEPNGRANSNFEDSKIHCFPDPKAAINRFLKIEKYDIYHKNDCDVW